MATMSHHRLYHDLAWLWPLLSPPSDYAAEAVTIREHIVEHFGPLDRPYRVLELGAGGGHTFHHLTATCHCTAVDLSDAMLANCRELNPDSRTIVGDMRNVRLNETFDVVMIHDAIDYLLTEADLAATIETAKAHLNEQGMLIIAPTYVRETFVDHETESDQNCSDKVELTYFSYVHDPDPADTTYEMILIYLIRQDGKVEVVEDRHICGLFSIDQWCDVLGQAGFEVNIHDLLSDAEESRTPIPMFIATRRPSPQR